jgi:hypothetical protein
MQHRAARETLAMRRPPGRPASSERRRRPAARPSPLDHLLVAEPVAFCAVAQARETHVLGAGLVVLILGAGLEAERLWVVGVGQGDETRGWAEGVEIFARGGAVSGMGWGLEG